MGTGTHLDTRAHGLLKKLEAVLGGSRLSVPSSNRTRGRSARPSATFIFPSSVHPAY